MLERAFGQDRLARIHRLVGFTSFNLMLAHVGLITWGYAAGRAARDPGRAVGPDRRTTPACCWPPPAPPAWSWSSSPASGRPAGRLRYESWHLLHLYAYLGVGLALPHQLWTGQEFLASTARTVFWWGLWIARRRRGPGLAGRAAAAGAAPRHGLRVTSVVPEGDGVLSVYLAGRAARPAGRRGRPVLHLAVPDRHRAGPGPTRTRSRRRPTAGSLRITVKDLGDGSARAAAAAARHPGAGRGPVRPAQRAGPHPAARSRSSAPASASPRCGRWPRSWTTRPATPSCSTASPAGRCSRASSSRSPPSGGCEVVRLPGHRRAPDSWLGDGVGRADDLTALTHWVPDIAERDVYVCGPEPWTDDVRRTTEAAGLPADHIHVETFGW